MDFVFSDIISLFALLLSVFIAGWTVYRDAIQKPKFRVEVGVKKIYQRHSNPIGPDFYVEALNIGPSRNRVGLVFARSSWWGRKIRKLKSAHIMHDAAHVGNSAHGQMVEVGDCATFVIPIHGAEFYKKDFVQIGVADGYGRVHWASRRNTLRAFKRAQEVAD